MWRVLAIVCMLGGGVALAREQPPPEPSANEPPAADVPTATAPCVSHERTACRDALGQRAEHELTCPTCAAHQRSMPAEVVAPPNRPLACAAREMPMSPTLPGCMKVPLDRIPPM